jgi:hypothetical protein
LASGVPWILVMKGANANGGRRILPRQKEADDAALRVTVA